ncbi:MAG: UbiA family prenyltransferase [Gammaproteobacteria bacterium]|nr:UbiA family prenyltransferase [Gammaproteobacteria bacterium]
MSGSLFAYLQLVRIPALFTAWSNILAAQLIAHAGRPDVKVMLLLLAASSALYLSGMVLNDCFDLSEDKKDRPSRPLPAGKIPVHIAWRLGWGLMILGLLLAGLAGWLQLAIALLLAITIIGYDGGLKKSPSGVLVMGSCRYLNWLLGLSTVPLTAASFLLPVPVFLYIVALSILGRIETRGHSPRSLVLCTMGILATTVSLLFLYLNDVLGTLWALTAGISILTGLMIYLAAGFRDMTPVRCQSYMQTMLLGIIPLDALLTLCAGPWWGALIVISMLIPGRLLARMLYVT